MTVENESENESESESESGGKEGKREEGEFRTIEELAALRNRSHRRCIYYCYIYFYPSTHPHSTERLPGW